MEIKVNSIWKFGDLKCNDNIKSILYNIMKFLVLQMHAAMLKCRGDVDVWHIKLNSTASLYVFWWNKWNSLFN